MDSRNIDLTVANYLNILGCGDITDYLDKNVIYAMRDVIVAYAKGAIKLREEIKQQQQVQNTEEEVNKLFR